MERLAIHGTKTMINRLCVVLSLLAVTASMMITAGTSVRAATTGFWTNSERVTHRYCIRHRHGDYWHSCSATRHPVSDQSHSHTGLPAYYASVERRGLNGLYFGIKSGSMRVDIAQSDAGFPGGLTAGFGRGEYALEIEATSTSLAVSSAAPVNVGAQTRFDSSFSTTALYGVRRIGEGFYTKMKVGISRSRYGLNGEKQHDTSASAGFGLGLRFGDVLLESEYTFVGSKATLFSVGASISF